MAVLTAGSFLMIGADSATDAFEGDGTKTSFTLSKTASANPEVTVTVSGTALTSGFSVSGKTLTFSTAPANNAPIVCKYSIDLEYAKLCDISQFPDMAQAPNAIDVTTLSDWAHVYIPALIDNGGNLEFSGFLDATTLPLVAAGTSDVCHLAFWVGGMKSGNTITPTGSILKIEFDGRYTAVLGGGGTDEAIPVTIAVTPETVPVYTEGSMNTNATSGS